MEELFKRLQAAELRLKPTKCELLQKDVKHLGHFVGPRGVATYPEKVTAVRYWPIPK